MNLDKITGCPKCGSALDHSPRCLECHFAELNRLRSLCTRWYLPDGTYETLPEEEVTRRRIEAAKRAGDVEGISNIMRTKYWQGTDADPWSRIARALSAFLSGKG